MGAVDNVIAENREVVIAKLQKMIADIRNETFVLLTRVQQAQSAAVTLVDVYNELQQHEDLLSRVVSASTCIQQHFQTTAGNTLCQCKRCSRYELLNVEDLCSRCVVVKDE